MTKTLNEGAKLRRKISRGVNILADYVSVTLGPKGQNVLLQGKDNQPIVTKDGVTVAGFVSLSDPVENAGATVVKQASAKTNSDAGDGTTTSTVLTRAIFNTALKYVDSGTSPIEIKRSLDTALTQVVEGLKEVAQPISSEEDVAHIAKISANNDDDIGNLIATAVDRVGKNGSITVEEARSLDTSLDLVEGFRFDSGYAAGAFITDERKKVVRYDSPMFLITDEKLETVDQILPALEIVARENKPLIIVADDIEGQALAALIMNTVRGSMKVAAVKGPRYGEERRSIMADLAIATGGKFFRRSEGHSLADVKLLDFGTARNVEISKGQTTVVDGTGDTTEIEKRIEDIKLEISETNDLHSAERLQERVTRLSSGIAVIKVGAATEIEMIEKKHRIEDALEAVRSAQQEGVVPGGGITLYNLSKTLSDGTPGSHILQDALKEPIRTMANNAGMSPEVCFMKLDTIEDNCTGIDFSNGETVNLLEKGVIDPAKVTRCALQNAVSVAGTLIMTSNAIIES